MKFVTKAEGNDDKITLHLIVSTLCFFVVFFCFFFLGGGDANVTDVPMLFHLITLGYQRLDNKVFYSPNDRMMLVKYVEED